MTNQETKGIINIKGQPYKTVALRLQEFRAQYPIESGWSIQIERTLEKETIICTARIYDPTGKIMSMGSAMGNLKQQNPPGFEVCETASVGRALAFAGFVGPDLKERHTGEDAGEDAGEAPKFYKLDKWENLPLPYEEKWLPIELRKKSLTIGKICLTNVTFHSKDGTEADAIELIRYWAEHEKGEMQETAKAAMELYPEEFKQ